MKQKLIILIALLSVGFCANAQEYRLAKSSGTLKLNITGVIVEGYDGKDIVFSGDKVVVEETSDERAKGLVPISMSKHVDNTGMGISVTENGLDVNVNLVAKKPIGVLTIKVPNNIKISIVNNGLFYSYSTNVNSGFTAISDNSKPGNDIVIKNIKSEIEVSVQNSKIRLENNTGPMSIKTVSGPIEAVFSSEIKGPVSIISATNYVDVTMPSSTKANIEMSTNSGKLYAGKEFKIDIDKDAVFEENLFSVGTRTTGRLSGLNTIQRDVTTSVSGVEVREKGKIAATSKTKTDEVIVTGYPASTTVTGVQINATGTQQKSTDKEAKERKANTKRGIEEVVVTGYPSSTSVTGVQINGNGNISSTNAINGVAVTRDRAYTTLGYAFGSGGDRIKGKLNGGGVDLIFKSTNKNVYLRQQ